MGGGALKNKLHLMNYSIVYKNKKNGSLGIRRLSILNK